MPGFRDTFGNLIEPRGNYYTALLNEYKDHPFGLLIEKCKPPIKKNSDGEELLDESRRLLEELERLQDAKSHEVDTYIGNIRLNSMETGSRLKKSIMEEIDDFKNVIDKLTELTQQRSTRSQTKWTKAERQAVSEAVAVPAESQLQQWDQENPKSEEANDTMEDMKKTDGQICNYDEECQSNKCSKSFFLWGKKKCKPSKKGGGYMKPKKSIKRNKSIKRKKSYNKKPKKTIKRKKSKKLSRRRMR